MTHPLGAVSLAFFCALLAALAASLYIERSDRSRLALAHVDFWSAAASAGGALSLVPEILNAFAPELLSGAIAGSALQNLDYAAYVLVPIGVGMGLARRRYVILNERAALAPVRAGSGA